MGGPVILSVTDSFSLSALYEVSREWMEQSPLWAGQRGGVLTNFTRLLFQHIPLPVSRTCIMSLCTMVRRKLLLRSSLTRHGSTFPSSSSPSTPTPGLKTPATQLSPEKMRALISLYHQSKDFISPANLSDKIDEVFAKDFYANGTSFAGYGNLLGMTTERRAAPIIGNPQTKDQVEPQRWSARPAAKREQMVVDALYGVDEDMPGLETLLDEEGRISKAAKDDEAGKSSA